MRMSKDLARRIASEMTAKKKKEYELLDKQITKEITICFVATIPRIILRAFKQYPGYFSIMTENYSHIHVHGPGIGANQYYAPDKKLPAHNSDRGLKLIGLAADRYVNMRNKYIDLKKAYDKMHLDIETALIGLSSFTRIQKEFPEAVKYLPKSTSQAIAVNIDKLREDLKK